MDRCRTSKLPAYVERVPLARRKKPDTWLIVGIEILMALLAIWAGVFVYYRSHELPYYATKFYAHLGSSVSQLLLVNLLNLDEIIVCDSSPFIYLPIGAF